MIDFRTRAEDLKSSALFMIRLPPFGETKNVTMTFASHTRREVAAKLKGLQIDTCSFANLPERKRTQWALTLEEMKNCVWVKPELIAQIEFGEWTPDGHLRHSRFVALRLFFSCRSQPSYLATSATTWQ